MPKEKKRPPPNVDTKAAQQSTAAPRRSARQQGDSSQLTALSAHSPRTPRKSPYSTASDPKGKKKVTIQSPGPTTTQGESQAEASNSTASQGDSQAGAAEHAEASSNQERIASQSIVSHEASQKQDPNTVKQEPLDASSGPEIRPPPQNLDNDGDTSMVGTEGTLAAPSTSTDTNANPANDAPQDSVPETQFRQVTPVHVGSVLPFRYPGSQRITVCSLSGFRKKGYGKQILLKPHNSNHYLFVRSSLFAPEIRQHATVTSNNPEEDKEIKMGSYNDISGMEYNQLAIGGVASVFRGTPDSQEGLPWAREAPNSVLVSFNNGRSSRWVLYSMLRKKWPHVVGEVYNTIGMDEPAPIAERTRPNTRQLQLQVSRLEARLRELELNQGSETPPPQGSNNEGHETSETSTNASGMQQEAQPEEAQPESRDLQYVNTLLRHGQVRVLPRSTEICTICTDTVSGPVELSCEHVFCANCLNEHIRRGRPASCPNCRASISLSRNVQDL